MDVLEQVKEAALCAARDNQVRSMKALDAAADETERLRAEIHVLDQ